MLIIIFTYNRQQWLMELLEELIYENVLIIDDGSDWLKQPQHKDYAPPGINHLLMRTPHDGKYGYWRKWLLAYSMAYASAYNQFLFIPDDFANINMEAIRTIASCMGDKKSYALMIINTGRMGMWNTNFIQSPSLQIGQHTLIDSGSNDCSMLTNRHTLSLIKIEPVNPTWFRNKDRSSGVGHMLSGQLRLCGATMYVCEKSLAVHRGSHDSVMHPEHRKIVPLVGI